MLTLLGHQGKRPDKAIFWGVYVKVFLDEVNIKISLCLSQFDLMKFGDIDSLVSALSKLIQRSLGRDQKHLLPLILNHLKIMIK